MAFQNVTFNGTTYSIPGAVGDTSWSGTLKVDGLLVALAGNALTKSGNTALTADWDIGGFGIKDINFLTSKSSTPALTGYVRLAETDSISWRNHANNNDVLLAKNTSDQLTYGGAVIVQPTTGAILSPSATNAAGFAVHGTNTNDNAAAGYVGEYIIASATGASGVNYPTSGNWGDLANITLTAGDWDVSLFFNIDLSGATPTATFRFGFSTTSGNSGTGLVFGDNSFYSPIDTAIDATMTNEVQSFLPAYRISISGTTTYYLKIKAGYTGGPPQVFGYRFFARRMR